MMLKFITATNTSKTTKIKRCNYSVAHWHLGKQHYKYRKNKKDDIHCSVACYTSPLTSCINCSFFTFMSLVSDIIGYVKKVSLKLSLDLNFLNACFWHSWHIYQVASAGASLSATWQKCLLCEWNIFTLLCNLMFHDFCNNCWCSWPEGTRDWKQPGKGASWQRFPWLSKTVCHLFILNATKYD